jgi:hypothetical protein
LLKIVLARRSDAVSAPTAEAVVYRNRSPLTESWGDAEVGELVRAG